MKKQKISSLAFGIFFLLLVLPLSLANLISVGDSSSGSIVVDSGNTGVVIGPVYEEPCGNRILDFSLGEQCDSALVYSCSSLGYNSGTLSCFDISAGSNKCTYDNQCYNLTTTTTGSGGSSGGGGGGGSSCDKNWKCTEWGVCKDGTQTRSCTTGCGLESTKPATSRDCTIEGASGDKGVGVLSDEPKKGAFSILTGAVIGTLSSPKVFIPLAFALLILAGALFVIIKKRKKKEK